MVYVGQGTDADFAKTDVKGKIVVADIVSDGLRVPLFRPNKFKWPDSFFTYDPGGTLANDENCENWPPSFATSYGNAAQHGAAGFVGILELMAGDMNQYLHWYAKYELPGVSISPRAGARLRETLRSGSAEATIVLTGFQGQGETYSIYGFVPGKNEDEIIAMMSPSRRMERATNEATVYRSSVGAGPRQIFRTAFLPKTLVTGR